MRAVWWLLAALLHTSLGGAGASDVWDHESADQEDEEGEYGDEEGGYGDEEGGYGDEEEYMEDGEGDEEGEYGDEEAGDELEGEEGEMSPEEFIQQIDLDRDGKMSLVELHTLIEREFGDGEEEADLSDQEKLDHRWEMETTKTRVRQYFEVADEDSDGFLNPQEAEALLKSMGEDEGLGGEPADQEEHAEQEEEEEDDEQDGAAETAKEPGL